MKAIFKPILKYYLKYVTKFVLFVHRPKIIAVAGSTNKGFVKDEVRRILREKGITARANERNFNTEIGLPLAVLHLPSGYNSYRNWIPTILQSLRCLFSMRFPDVLVLELGASGRGDMRHLLSIVRPTISIVTEITQRYMEAFSSMDHLMSEYELLVRRTAPEGLVILNYDNVRLRRLLAKTKKRGRPRAVSFGFTEGADWQAVAVRRVQRGEEFALAVADQNDNECWQKKDHGEGPGRALPPAEAGRHTIPRYGRHNILAAVVGLIVAKNIRLIKQ